MDLRRLYIFALVKLLIWMCWLEARFVEIDRWKRIRRFAGGFGLSAATGGLGPARPGAARPGRPGPARPEPIRPRSPVGRQTDNSCAWRWPSHDGNLRPSWDTVVIVLWVTWWRDCSATLDWGNNFSVGELTLIQHFTRKLESGSSDELHCKESVSLWDSVKNH